MKGKRRSKKCFCGAVIIPDKKVGSRQKTCGSKDCQKELKRRNNERWRKNNPDHWHNDYARVKAWNDANLGHLKEYRKSNPAYVRKCREAQKHRDRSKRLHLDIQDKIKRQAPDIIAQLLDKAHLGNLDKQAKTVIKPLEPILLLALLTSLTNQS